MKCRESEEAFLSRTSDFVVFGGACLSLKWSEILEVNVNSGVKCNKCAFKYGDFRLKRKRRQNSYKMLCIFLENEKIEGTKDVVARLLDM